MDKKRRNVWVVINDTFGDGNYLTLNKSDWRQQFISHKIFNNFLCFSKKFISKKKKKKETNNLSKKYFSVFF